MINEATPSTEQFGPGFLSEVYRASKMGALDALKEAGIIALDFIPKGDTTQAQAYREYGRYDVEKWVTQRIVRTSRTGPNTSTVLYFHEELEAARKAFGCAKDRKAARNRSIM